jgi:hypothetical protein
VYPEFLNVASTAAKTDRQWWAGLNVALQPRAEVHRPGPPWPEPGAIRDLGAASQMATRRKNCDISQQNDLVPETVAGYYISHG